MIDNIAQSMVERLKAEVEGFNVEHFPDKPTPEALAQKRASLFVNFDGSTFGEPTSLEPLACDETAKFVVSLRVLSQRGQKGAMATLAAVRFALFGWTPALEGAELGASAFIPVDSGFVDVTDGVWRFAIAFKTTFPTIAGRSEETGPLLKTVTTKPKE